MNNMQKIYVSAEEKKRVMDKLNRDIEVRKALTKVCTECMQSVSRGHCAHRRLSFQFLVHMRIMDYSLLLGIHDVERAEREEDEEEMESSYEEGEEEENGLVPAPHSTSPEGIAGHMNSLKPVSPGEVDPYVDVYAIQCAVGELWPERTPLTTPIQVKLSMGKWFWEPHRFDLICLDVKTYGTQ